MPRKPPPLDLNKPPFQTERGERVYFVGHTSDGRTVWEPAEAGGLFIRNADGRKYAEHHSGDDVINAPPPKVKEVLWANIYPPSDLLLRGYLYSTEELARAKVSESASESVLGTFKIEVEYTPKEPQ